MKRICAVFLFFIFYFLFFILPVRAQISPSLAVSPAKYDLAVVPDQPQQVQIKITNRSTVALPLKVAVMDFAPSDENGAVAFNRSIPGHSATSWFQIPRPDLLLNANETTVVSVTIVPPETVSPGSYFAVVMFQSNLPDYYFNPDAQAHVVPWIGTLFLLKLGEPSAINDSSLKVTSLHVPRFSLESRIPVVMEVENTTGFHLTPNAEFELKNVFGRSLVKINTEDTTILPGARRIFRAEFIPARLASANPIWVVGAHLQLGNYRQSIESAPLYMVYALIGLLVIVLGILYFSRHYHRRFVKAVRVLTGLRIK